MNASVSPAVLKNPDDLAYAELQALSSFSFQRGASQPGELVQRAADLGYAALALTDECSVAGVVRAHEAALACGLKLVLGAQFAVSLERGEEPVHQQAAVGHFTAVVLARNLAGWGQLCELITAARRAAPKGQYRMAWHTPVWQARWATLSDCEVLLQFPLAINFEAAYAVSSGAKGLFGTRCWLAAPLRLGLDDVLQRQRLEQLARCTALDLVAVGDVHMHVRSRKPLHDVLTAVRLGQPVSACGWALQPNAELHLRSRERLAALYPHAWRARTVQIAQRCRFDLRELRYHYPLETVLPGKTPAQTLQHHCAQGLGVRYPQGVPVQVQEQLEHELALIAELRFEMYFLTVFDIVRFAREQGILCQGRGSAANSVVCYLLGITEVDPRSGNLLFERFISRERNEPPDIDVDFEHQRREEVIQYIYAKYGRSRAAIAATVISYRPRSALRDVGRSLGIADDVISALCREHPGMYSREILAERLHDALCKVAQARGVAVDTQADCEALAAPLGLTPLQLSQWLAFATTLQRFPRHLSQHVGGFVLTQGPLTRLVPVENAAMPERSIIQWDKDDLDAVGLMKVDVLALGMLSAIRRCLTLVTQWRQLPTPMRMQDVPREDAATYDMICAADTVGVFQIESRAQMSMLPRLKPRCFYDLVVEVAIVRPGPIQGGMVHPYLKAREATDETHSPYPALRKALGRTHGVPIFQEQVMQIAVLAAGFTPGEADALRRSMAAWKRHGNVSQYHDRLVGGMLERGYPQDFAEAIFKQMEGFGEYGFPESHAASFAILVYISSWLKKHEPACFLAALLNSQPLGFYSPSQLVQDARRHGVEVLPVDVSHSGWDCTLEPWGADDTPAQPGVCSAPHGAQPAIRLGLRQVSGLRQAVAERIVAERVRAPFAGTEDLALRCALNEADLRTLASADALLSLSGHRRQQVWDAAALRSAPALFRGVAVHEPPLALDPASTGQEVVLDYAALGLSLRAHPVQLLREALTTRRLQTHATLMDLPSGRLVRACGIVTMRQRPQTAKGVVFVTLEDETGHVNVIVWKAVREKFRQTLYQARLLAVHGVWQRDDDSGGQVCHVIAHHLVDLTHLLGALTTSSRDFR